MIDLAAFAPPIIPAVITGVLSAWLTAALAFGRSKREKIWDARLSSYQKILSDLHDMGSGFDEMFEATMQNVDVTLEEKSIFRERYVAGQKSLKHFLYTSDLLLHQTVRSRIEKLFRDVESAQATIDWNTYLDGSSAAIWKCTRDITVIARGHLGI